MALSLIGIQTLEHGGVEWEPDKQRNLGNKDPQRAKSFKGIKGRTIIHVYTVEVLTRLTMRAIALRCLPSLGIWISVNRKGHRKEERVGAQKHPLGHRALSPALVRVRTVIVPRVHHTLTQHHGLKVRQAYSNPRPMERYLGKHLKRCLSMEKWDALIKQLTFPPKNTQVPIRLPRQMILPRPGCQTSGHSTSSSSCLAGTN